VGTTIASDWDGQTVHVACKPDLVQWAVGCGWTGRIAPFGGAAKLPWNLEWAAQWNLFGVTIEPNGKDLATAGGSRDRSNAIAREVFEREPPINFPYEFLNIGGKKMSTSKGRGAAAHTIGSVVPPEQLRFLFVRQRPETALDFDPEGTDAIPRLFDEFDRLASATAGKEVKGELPSGYENIFRFSLLDPDADLAVAADQFRPAFAHLALLVQIPGIEVRARVETEKGAPLTEAEAAELEIRLAAVRRWLDAYAPERAIIEVKRDSVPIEVEQLRPEQRGFLRALADAAHGDAPATGEQWQSAIFAVAAEHGLDGKGAFNALYLSFLGRPNGPRAGWLLASLERDFVIRRLTEAGAAAAE
jgi:lysyl-tRNA synthetase class 1